VPIIYYQMRLTRELKHENKLKLTFQLTWLQSSMICWQRQSLTSMCISMSHTHKMYYDYSITKSNGVGFAKVAIIWKGLKWLCYNNFNYSFVLPLLC